MNVVSKNVGLLILDEVYAPVVGRCNVHEGAINIDNKFKHSFYLMPFNFERKDKNAIYTIENVYINVDYDKHKAVVTFKKCWIGGLVESDSVEFDFSIKKYKHEYEDITRVVIYPLEDGKNVEGINEN